MAEWWQNDARMMPEWCQNDAKMMPKWCQNDARMGYFLWWFELVHLPITPSARLFFHQSPVFMTWVPVSSRAFPWSLVHHGSSFVNKTEGKHYSKLSNSVQSLVATNIATGTLGNKTVRGGKILVVIIDNPTKLSVGPKDVFFKNPKKSISGFYKPKTYPILSFDNEILHFRIPCVILAYQMYWFPIKND